MGICSDPPPPPDMTPFAEASVEAAELAQQTAREQLDWAREQDTLNRETLNRVLDVQLPAMEEQARQAREDRRRYEEQFLPVEEQFIQDALTYDSPERVTEERGRAMADVTAAFDAQRRNALRRLEGFGVDPSQTRNQALDIGVRTAQAAQQAAAGTGARRRVEDVGRALRSDVVNLGRGVPSQVAQSYGGAIGAGQAAVGGSAQTTGASTGAFSPALGFMGQGMQGYGQAGQLVNAGYGNQLAAWQGSQNQLAGNLAGAGALAGMFLADGGDVDPRMAIPFDEDGPVDVPLGDGSGIDDSVPAYLSEGEYVIPADVVRRKGEEFFDKLIEKYHTPASQQRAAMGG